MKKERNFESGFRICQNRGFHIKFENGWVVSVQFGAGNYCENYDNIEMVENCNPIIGAQSMNAEVWCFNKDKNYPKEPLGYQTPKDVLKILNKISKRKKVD